MFYPKIFISSLAMIVFVHVSIFFFVNPVIEKPIRITDSNTVVKIALKKVYVKQEKKEIVKEVKVEKKEVKEKPKEIVKPKVKPTPPRKIKPKKTIKKRPVKQVRRKPRRKPRRKKQEVEQREIEQTVIKRAKRVERREEPVVSDSDLVTYRYLRRLKRAMERNKTYPPQAKSEGQEGVVIVSFIIQKSGLLTNTQVTMGCLYAQLNNAAKRIPVKIGTFEPIPRILNKSSWAIEVPITYEIEND